MRLSGGVLFLAILCTVGAAQGAGKGRRGLPSGTSPDLPLADFAYHSSPEGTQLVDQSSGVGIDTWMWSIEDYDSDGHPIQIVRDIANPFHRFTKPDGHAHDPKQFPCTYAVTLTVTNATGSTSITKDVRAEFLLPRTVVLPSVRTESTGATMIQNALDLPFPDGLHGAPGTVLLGSGVYEINASIRLHSGQKLVGISPPSASWDKGEPQDGTILQYTGPTSDFAIEVDLNAQWCEIRNLFVLDGHPGSPFARGAIHLDAAWHTTIENVLIDEFGTAEDPGHVDDAPRGYGILVERGLFTRILNCRMRGCDVFAEFSDHANQNLIQGGHYTMNRTNSAVVIRGSTSNSIFGASFEQPGSGGSESFFSVFEFIAGSHTSVLANRIELNDGNIDVGVRSWHYSFDDLSKNNMIFGNQFTDYPVPNTVGRAAIRNPAGAAARLGTSSGTIVRREDLGRERAGEVVYRFAIPPDWVGTALNFEIDHVLVTGAPSQPVDLEVAVDLVRSGARPPSLGGYDQTIQVPGLPVSVALGALSVPCNGLPAVTKEHRYVEVRVRRTDLTKTGAVSIEHMTMTYEATDTPFVR